MTDASLNRYGVLDVCSDDLWQISDGIAGMAQHLAAAPGAPVMIVAEAVSGTGVNQLVDDAISGRSWSWMTGPLLGRSGSDIAAIAINWATNFMGDGDVTGNHIVPLIEGPVGATISAFDGDYDVDHCLSDGTFPGTTVIVPMGLTRHTGDSAPDDRAYSGSPSGYLYTADKARREWLAYAADNALPSGPPTIDFPTVDDGSFGFSDGFGPHQMEYIASGSPRLGLRVLVAGLRGAGIDTTEDSRLDAVTRSGAVLTVTTDLRNGGTLQTAWSHASESPPLTGINDGDENPVQGFEVNETSADETAWTRSSFTTAIVGSTVTLTRTTGSWAANTRVRYAAGGPLSHGDADRDNALISGLLYESGLYEGGLGLPLRAGWTGTAA